MHTYTLTITKDDFLLEFKSTDKYIVEKELGVWITAAAQLLDEMEPYVPPLAPPEPEKIELGRIVVERPQVAPPQIQPIKQEMPVQQPPIEEKELQPVAITPTAPLPTVEEKQHHSYKISDETKEILQRAIHKPKPSMQEIIAEKQIKEYKPTEVATPVRETPKAPKDFPPVQTPPPLPQQHIPQVAPIEQIAPQEDFTTIFNQKIAQEHNNTDKFAQLLSLQNIHNKFDCLIACAYHLVERENFERFTLKQINTLSKALLEEAIEHDTLKDALERRYIKIVPDYTGIATTMEYTLTDQGIKYFEREILGT